MESAFFLLNELNPALEEIYCGILNSAVVLSGVSYQEFLDMGRAPEGEGLCLRHSLPLVNSQ